jgi:ATP-dependent DNA ligase
MQYTSFKYIFPPRPEIKAPQTSIERFEELNFTAQPKLNGSCGVLFTDGKQFKFMNRHRLEFAKTLIPSDELLSLHRGKSWTVLVGEHMNKSQRGADKKVFNGKYVIFDILVHNGVHLVGTTFEERQKLLEKLYRATPHDSWISKISENVYRVNNISNAETQWKDLTEVEMYEGFVFKKKSGKLDLGFKKENNMSWQVKVRKPTKNYSY